MSCDEKGEHFHRDVRGNRICGVLRLDVKSRQQRQDGLGEQAIQEYREPDGPFYQDHLVERSSLS